MKATSKMKSRSSLNNARRERLLNKKGKQEVLYMIKIRETRPEGLVISERLIKILHKEIIFNIRSYEN